MARDTGMSLMNAAEGFMRGYGFVQNMKDQQQMRGLRDLESQRSQERHDTYMKSAEQDMSLRGKREEREVENHRINRARALMENQELTLGIMAKNAYAMEKSGYVPEFSKEEQEALELFPQLRPDYDMTGALQVAEEVIAGKRSINSPEALESINVLFPEVQTGADDGRKRRVTMVAPGKEENTLVFGLEVEGETSPKPLTVRRSSSNDDPVKQVKVEDMVKKIASLKQMNELKNNPKFRQFLIQRAGLGGQQEQEPEDIRKARYLQQEMARQGKNVSLDEAYRMSKTTYRLSSTDQGGAGGGGRSSAPKDLDKAARDHAYRMTQMAQRSAGDFGDFNQDETFNRYYTQYLRDHGVAPPESQSQPKPFQSLDELLAEEF